MVYKINYSDSIIFTLPSPARVDWKRAETCEISEHARHAGKVRIPESLTSSRAQRAATGEVSE